MEPSEILKLTRKCLLKASNEIRKEVNKLPEAEKAEASQLAVDCLIGHLKLVNAQLKDILAQLKENEKDLTDGTKRLNEALKNLKEVKEVLDAASSLLSIVAKVVAVTAAPSAIPVFSLLKEKAAFAPKVFLSEESKAMPEEFLAEEKTAFVPIEEVLYKVELTPAKLIITVDAGWNRSVEVVFRNKLNC